MSTPDRESLPLRLESVSFLRRGAPLLDGIDLELRAGRRTIIMGPNGAGKSLLLRICHGLINPTSGHVTCGHMGSPLDVACRRRQAMVFQRPVMLRRSAYANVAYALALRRLSRAERRRRTQEALALLDLEHLAGRSARVLSGGEQQRLALARAWVLAPDVLFLDEPTSALDPHATQAVERAVQRFHDAGTKVVMTTHDLGQARRLADEVVFLNQGRLETRADAQRFFADPGSIAARSFLAGEIVPRAPSPLQNQKEELKCSTR